nr:acyl-CoA dehydrogenase family protein [Kineobactrum salinum]
MPKWRCTEHQGEVLDECLQFFRGYGYMAEYPAADLYADPRVHAFTPPP